VVDKQHDGLVFGLFQGHQVKAVHDLDIRIAEAVGQGVQRARINDVATLDGYDLVFDDRPHSDQPSSFDRTWPTLYRLWRDVAGSEHDVSLVPVQTWR
jgi:hypothetical protein